MSQKTKKLLIMYLPYVLVGLVATNLGEAWRLATGGTAGEKILSLMYTVPQAFGNPLPSLHPFDLLIGLLCGGGLRLAVYLKGKNAKKYRHNMEYGSARWGTAKDIEPFMAPKFEDNIILTRTERLMMSNRPKDPANARNKNVLIVGGSGSGKTRFWLKPNLLQMHSSYVVTDPKGSIVVECGNAMLKHGYRIKIFNTINFKKSQHYNPFAYIHSEKDILKLVTTLITNTKGDGKGGDPFWEKAETLLYGRRRQLLPLPVVQPAEHRTSRKKSPLPAALLAARLINRLKLLPLAVLPAVLVTSLLKRLLLVARLTNRLRLPPLAVLLVALVTSLLKRLLLVVRLTNRLRLPLLAVLPAVRPTSNFNCPITNAWWIGPRSGCRFIRHLRNNIRSSDFTI